MGDDYVPDSQTEGPPTDDSDDELTATMMTDEEHTSQTDGLPNGGGGDLMFTTSSPERDEAAGDAEVRGEVIETTPPAYTPTAQSEQEDITASSDKEDNDNGVSATTLTTLDDPAGSGMLPPPFGGDGASRTTPVGQPEDTPAPAEDGPEPEIKDEGTEGEANSKEQQGLSTR